STRNAAISLTSKASLTKVISGPLIQVKKPMMKNRPPTIAIEVAWLARAGAAVVADIENPPRSGCRSRAAPAMPWPGGWEQRCHILSADVAHMSTAAHPGRRSPGAATQHRRDSRNTRLLAEYE